MAEARDSLFTSAGDPAAELSTMLLRRRPQGRCAASWITSGTVSGTYASSEVIAITPDGRSLYSAGSRTNPAAEPGSLDEFIAEIVCYDIRGPRLVRRWAFEHPMICDSVKELAVTPDGRFLLALRAQDSTALLMQLSVEKGDVIKESRLSTDPGRCAISPDHSRLALGCEGIVRLLDTVNLRELHTRDLRVNLNGLRWLSTGELLVATDTAVLRLNPTGDEPATIAAPLRCHSLATDAGETLLAVARSIPITPIERENPKEFGITLLRLPSFELARTVLVPNHQAVTPALSPDSSLIAFAAHEIRSPRICVAVFETATGREIARRKSNYVHALAFLPDNKTLAIAGTDITTTVPIALWSIPHG